MQMEKAQNAQNAFSNNRNTQRRPSISASSSKINNANYNQQQPQQSATFQVPHRRASMSAPYTIPNKSNNTSTSQNNQSNLSASLNGSVSSPPHTGGPIHTRHYPFTNSNNTVSTSNNTTSNTTSNHALNLSYQQQQNQLQQQLQQQFQQQFQQAHAQVQAQHNSSQSNVIPMLSREFVVRRISEGESGRLKEELKCEACGKGYKHISSLAKHLWEHTPEWQMTKKLLISKHQQVQLLEAASILCGMSDNGTPTDQSDKLSVSAPSSNQIASTGLRQRSPSISNNNNSKKIKGKSVIVSPSPESEPLEDPQYIPNTSHSSTSSASPLPTLNNDPVNSATSTTTTNTASTTPSTGNPIFTTTIRKNSMSQYPPSSLLSTSLSSTPSKLTSGSLKQQLLGSQQNNVTCPNTSITESMPMSSSYSSRRGSVMLQVPKINEENGEEYSNEQYDLEQELAAKGVVYNNRKFAPRYNNHSAATSPDVDEGVFGEMES